MRVSSAKLDAPGELERELFKANPFLDKSPQPSLSLFVSLPLQLCTVGRSLNQSTRSTRGLSE